MNNEIWEVHDLSRLGDEYDSATICRMINGNTCTPILEAVCGDSPEDVKRLYLAASAPQMFSAIQGLLVIWDNYDDTGPIPLDEAIEKAREAIKPVTQHHGNL